MTENPPGYESPDEPDSRPRIPGRPGVVKPLKVARPLEEALPAPAEKMPSRPQPTDGGLARPLSLAEARAAGIVPRSSRHRPRALVNGRPVDEKDPDNEDQRQRQYWTLALSGWGTSMFVHMALLITLGVLFRVDEALHQDVTVTMDQSQQAWADDIQAEAPRLDGKGPGEAVDPRRPEALGDALKFDHLDPGSAASDIKIPLLKSDLQSPADSSASTLESLGQTPTAQTFDPTDTVNLGGSPEGTGKAPGTGKMSIGGGSGYGQGRGKGSGVRVGRGGTGSGGSALGGRMERRQAYLMQSGPYALPSEQAVDAGLVWLAHHQLADGGWSFEHRGGECQGRCPNQGELGGMGRIAATGFALLPFLGSGNTYLEGPYRRNVAGGLKFLMAHENAQGSLVEPGGMMYGHGIATLALCEAAGMIAQRRGAKPEPPAGASAFQPNPRVDRKDLTKEERIALDQQKKELERQRQIERALFIDPIVLNDAARRAARFINAAQNREGGWRYWPGESGDMSVLGWQIMALSSAQHAGFGFDAGVRARAMHFLQICGADPEGDSNYGAIYTQFTYRPPAEEKSRRSAATRATTAIGLLSMIYMGLSPHHPGMELSVMRLLQTRPRLDDMYYTYYANQIMYQHGGDAWTQWDEAIRNMLVPTQSKDGHMTGSWFLMGDLGSKKGGRVYCTVMALLCLEENYRHLQLFQNALGNQQAFQKGPGGAGHNAPGANPNAANGGPIGGNGAAANRQPGNGQPAGGAAVPAVGVPNGGDGNAPPIAAPGTAGGPPLVDLSGPDASLLPLVTPDEDSRVVPGPSGAPSGGK